MSCTGFPIAAPALPLVSRTDARFKTVTAAFCASHKKMYSLDSLDSLDFPKTNPGRVAVHLHLYYLDLLDEFAVRLGNIPCPFDLFVSITDASAREIVLNRLGHCPKIREIRVAAAENRGRDIAPMIAEFGTELSSYDLFLHIHTKKSPHLAAGWRALLLSSLIPDVSHVRRIFSLFNSHPELGILYPEPPDEFPYWSLTALTNEPEMRRLFTLLRLEFPDNEKYLDFPAGTMFWARGAALERLLCSDIRFDYFPEEAGQLDGTPAHAIERSLCIIASAAGFSPAQLDIETGTVSIGAGMRNLGPLLLMCAADAEMHLGRFKRVSFDIFGTLLCSSYPDDRALWRDMERRLGHPFAELRENAASYAFDKSPVSDIHDIYIEYRRLSGLTEPECEKIKDLEFRLLTESCQKRAFICDIFAKLAALGCDIIAADDSLWPRPYIERLLNVCGISCPNILLSREHGLLKGGGGMYKLLSRRFKGRAFIHIGDHELDDITIPNALGIPALHVMNPHDMIKIARLDEANFDRCRDDPFCLGELTRQAASL